jgi:TetR/AcrR family transcriptional regulator, transcriptional repressor for nem operon
MASPARQKETLTPKGRRTRVRIIDAAAELIYKRGVTATTLEDVKAAAAVSSSQLYHYFANKETLVQAVIDRQADTLVAATEHADLGTIDGLRAWRELVLTQAEHTGGKGGCPLGSLGSQLAESDPHARARTAAGFGRWPTAIRDGLRALHTSGHLAPDINPDDLAVTLLAALQGGLLLAQVQRDTRSLQATLDTLLALAQRCPSQP